MSNTWKILVTATAIITIGLWIVPGFESIKILETDVGDLKQQKNEKNNIIKILRAESKKGAESSEAILRAIPFSREQEVLIQDLKNISIKTGFVFKGLSFGKGQNPALSTAQTTISFVVFGQKKRIPEFLTLLENNTRFIGTDTLNITIKEKEGESLSELKISLYALSQEL